MRVLIVSGGKPTKKYPFIGNFAFEQAVALADSGTDVTFFGIDLRSFRRKRLMASLMVSQGKFAGMS